MASAVPFRVCKKLRPAAFGPVADGEAPGLVVGGVGGAGHFAEVVPSRHPGFQVILAVGGPAEVAGADVYHPERQAETLEDPLLYADHLLVDLLGLLRRGEGEHLDFRKLVDPIETPARPAVGTRFGAEAVRESGVAERELELIQR